MKEFDGFIKYMSQGPSKESADIIQKVFDKDYSDLLAEGLSGNQAFTFAVLTATRAQMFDLLRKYHEWLNFE